MNHVELFQCPKCGGHDVEFELQTDTSGEHTEVWFEEYCVDCEINFMQTVIVTETKVF